MHAAIETEEHIHYAKKTVFQRPLIFWRFSPYLENLDIFSGFFEPLKISPYFHQPTYGHRKLNYFKWFLCGPPKILTFSGFPP
jgi:hypothetical protein